MSESIAHIELVQNMKKWISVNIDDIVEAFVYTHDSNSGYRPPIISGYIPDFYYHNSSKDLTVIGEAKTAKDIEARHSIEQFRAYMEHASMAETGHLIIAVPWHATRTAARILRGIKSRSGIATVSITIIQKLAG